MITGKSDFKQYQQQIAQESMCTRTPHQHLFSVKAGFTITDFTHIECSRISWCTAFGQCYRQFILIFVLLFMTGDLTKTLTNLQRFCKTTNHRKAKPIVTQNKNLKNHLTVQQLLKHNKILQKSF